MGSFIIDSIGFSASHAMNEIFRAQDSFLVAHGCRNFKQNGWIGQNDQTPSDFLADMIELQGSYRHCVAIHCLFNPQILAEEALKQGVAYYGLCRKNTPKQVLSCFFWAVKKFLDGHVGMQGHVIQILEQHNQTFVRLRLPANYVSALMLYSLTRVVHFNIALAEHSLGLIFMEDFLVCPQSLLRLLGEPTDGVKIEVPHTVSHKQLVANYDFLNGYEETFETLQSAVTFDFVGEPIKASELYDVIADKNVLDL